MTKRRNRHFHIDLGEILLEPVRITINGKQRSVSPFEAELEQWAAKALGHGIAACGKFINFALREGIIEKPPAYDPHEYVALIPEDCEDEEFKAKYMECGPPPWSGERDGLTAEAREQRKARRRRSRR